MEDIAMRRTYSLEFMFTHAHRIFGIATSKVANHVISSSLYVL